MVVIWQKDELSKSTSISGVHLISENIFVGAKHSGSKSLLLTNKLSAGMLRPCKIEMHPISAYSSAMVNQMDNPILEQIKSKYRLGQFVQGKVEYHATFGVFVDLGEATVKGLIKIP